MSARSLVTGANGFVGQHLCRALQEHGGVRALLRKHAEGPWDHAAIVDLGAASLPAGLMDGIDVVYHVAGRAHVLDEAVENVDAFRRVNVEGTRQVYQAAIAANVRCFVLVSSVAALADGGSGVIAENAEPRPASAYGQSKREAERIVLGQPRVVWPVVLRLPLIYGPGAPGNLRRMIEVIRSGRFPPVPRIDNRRSMIHVDDVVRALILTGGRASAAGRAYTVTDGYAYSARDVYEAIMESLGRRVPSWTVPASVLRGLARIGDVAAAVTRRRWPFDTIAYEKLFGSAEYECSAIVDELGFRPAWDLRRAMPAIVENTLR